MNIGQAAEASGVSAKMIRYYEQTALISPAARTDAGYRTYSDDDVHTLRFIRRARDLGFTVEGIAELLSLWRDRSRQSADVKEMALGHVAALRRKIAELEGMAATLQTLAECCSGDNRPDCPILKDLATGTPAVDELAPRRFGVPGEFEAVRPGAKRRALRRSESDAHR
ncbi:MAG: Cu(I)-responsive transcriptional regulator [Allosphingosinicella sp.]|uniref:Cu(I)-responsive transcriptional regulator n=1 Tax=Allosphingosinicella sp. TaxID=2823234 RepID=UPI003942C069